jgi:hypothetical protein
MPSVGEIFTVSGVAVGSGVEVSSSVAITGIWVCVAVGAGVAVDGGSVAVFWQAARKKMERRNGAIFFIESLFVGQAYSLTILKIWVWRVTNPPYLKPLLNQ